MFLRGIIRKKDGKEHRYFSVVENRRLQNRRVVQRTVLYLGEINDSQQEAWQKSLEVFDETQEASRQIRLFPEDRPVPEGTLDSVQVKLSQMRLHRPRAFGDCWLGCWLWEQLELDRFWEKALPLGRESVRWSKVLQVLVINRLIEPGSEWSIHRHWFLNSAMDQLVGEDFVLAEKNRLYRCLDRLLPHRDALFSHLKERWQDLFSARFDVLLYDLTSTYFEGEMEACDQAKHGYSRDGRPDCRQVVIALVVTPDGFPMAYELMPGNTSDKTTLKPFLEKIEGQYGKANRVWIMDRGIPTEEILAQMRTSDTPVSYLVGTPRGRLSKLEAAFLDQPWESIRESVRVKLLSHEGELYVLAKSRGRQAKEQAMRRRRLKKLWKSLNKLKEQRPNRDELLLRLGAARKEAGRAYGLVSVHLPKEDASGRNDTFTFSLNKEKLRQMRRREGCYLLRSNLTEENPAVLWEQYILLTEIEAAFKTLKSDLAIRPVYHQLPNRIEAHILVAFLAYCLMVTLKKRLNARAPGLTPRAVLKKLSSIQMIDVHFPTTDGRELRMPRYTQPQKEHYMILEQLGLQLPPQPPPRITIAGHTEINPGL